MVGRLFSYFSWQMFWFDPTAVHVGFVVDKLTVGAGLCLRISVLFSTLSSHWNIKSHNTKPRTCAHTTDVRHLLSKQRTYLTRDKEPDGQATYKVHCAYGLTPSTRAKCVSIMSHLPQPQYSVLGN